MQAHMGMFGPGKAHACRRSRQHVSTVGCPQSHANVGFKRYSEHSITVGNCCGRNGKGRYFMFGWVWYKQRETEPIAREWSFKWKRMGFSNSTSRRTTFYFVILSTFTNTCSYVPT
jgi:hypothetical protein